MITKKNLLFGMVFFCFFTGWSQASYLSEEKVEDGFCLQATDCAPVFYLDEKDFEGVHLVAQDLQNDFKKVTNKTPSIVKNGAVKEPYPIIIGTLGNNRWIDDWVGKDILDVSKINDKRDSFLVKVMDHPNRSGEKALVIVGSDKRGTIYGMYDLSEKMGISPWHWWADVPVTKKDRIYIRPSTYHLGPPKVKYRGIFINDEEPAFGNWAREKFGGINSELYEHVFKLILRLKGNFLWPAMWGKAFNEDDPRNPVLADIYGIVMSTSHHEPMMRAQKEWTVHRDEYGNGEWDYQTNEQGLQEFWTDGFTRNKDYEQLVTVGMRGDGDEPMTESTAISLLEKIITDQREIIANTTGKSPAETPQVWALYKEVQEYYDQGMEVPEDITLLFSDDNWGNIRRFPQPDEPKRPGGYGIYYHFDYVGGPRSYKWLNTTQIERVWEQMTLAYHHGADELWVVNVGDLKPMELPISFFLDLAWDPEQMSIEKLRDYTRKWSEGQFGKEYAKEIAEILNSYTQYNSRRKPELLTPETYSLNHFGEADRVVEEYNALARKAEQIYQDLAPAYRDAFFQLVLFPVQISANLNELYVTVAKNRQYAQQKRSLTNELADRAEKLFERDSLLTEAYHRHADGKWNHMMSQTHIGYTYWNEPPKQVMPEVNRIKMIQNSQLVVAVQGTDKSWPISKELLSLPQSLSLEDGNYAFEIFTTGEQVLDFQIKPQEDWILLSKESGKLEGQQKIEVAIDWEKVPKGKTTGLIEVVEGDNSVKIEVPVHKITDKTLTGFVENNGYIAMEAAHFLEDSAEGTGWSLISNLGRTHSAVSSFVEKPTRKDKVSGRPLTYAFHNFTTGEVKLEFLLSPTLDFLGKGGLRFAYAVDDENPQILNMHRDTEDDWDTTVKNNSTKVRASLNLKKSGNHRLKIWAMDSGVSLQKIVIYTQENEPETYLGPPESSFVKGED